MQTFMRGKAPNIPDVVDRLISAETRLTVIERALERLPAEVNPEVREVLEERLEDANRARLRVLEDVV